MQDTNKLSPLLLAVSKGNEMIVRNLLLAGASVDDVNPSGQTALQIAAENGLSEIARFTEFHQKKPKALITVDNQKTLDIELTQNRKILLCF